MISTHEPDNGGAQAVFALLKQWCDGLLAHQIPEAAGARLAGGFLCPACARVHGRSADAVYPLLYMAQATGEDGYKRQRYLCSKGGRDAWPGWTSIAACTARRRR